MAAEKKMGTVRVTLVRGLGLKWRNHTVELQNTPETRGMINKIGYMLRVTEAKG